MSSLRSLVKRKSTFDSDDDFQFNRVAEQVLHLPEHLFYSISLKLPDKSLVRFLTLSKLWNGVFTSRRFFMDRKMISPELVVTNIVYTRFDSEKQKCYLYVHKIWGSDCQSQCAVELPYPIHDEMNKDWICLCASASDGLLGLVYMNRHEPHTCSIVIWNPCTGQKKYVSLPEGKYLVKPSTLEGFGYDSSIDDYKIVLIEFNDPPSDTVQIMVRALKSDEWRTVSCAVLESSEFKRLSVYSYNLVLVDGDIWWIARTNEDDGLVLMKLCLAEEKLSTVSLPPETNDGGPSCCANFMLCRYNDSLYLIGKGFDSTIYIWRRMKQENNDTGWELSHRIPVSEDIIPVGFTSNGTFIMESHSDNTFSGYDLSKKSTVTFKLDESLHSNTSSMCGTYLLEIETLISP